MPMWTWRDVLLVVGAYLPASLIGVLAAQLLPVGAGGVAGRPLLAQFLVYALMVGVVWAVARMAVGSAAGDGLGLRAPWRAVVLGLIGGPGLAVAMGLIGGLLRAPSLDTVVQTWLADRASLPWVALFIVVLAPLVEELLFRGFIQPLAVQAIGPVAGIGLVALAFAVMHGPTYHWSWQHLVLMAFTGCAFGAMRQASGSTLAAAALHAAYNGTMLYAYLK